jgi:hypothetical protein
VITENAAANTEESHQQLISETAAKFGSTDTRVLGRCDVGDMSLFPQLLTN